MDFRQRCYGTRHAGAAIFGAGCGILSSVRATRGASDDDLLSGAAARLDRLIADRVTPVDVKYGYGLDLATEARMLQVAMRPGAVRDVGVRTSFLGAHALPPETRCDKDAYCRLVADARLPPLHAEGLVDAVDGFCEGIASSPDQIARVFDAARTLGLPEKLHANQLSNLGGAALASRHCALSANHLEHRSDAGVSALTEVGTVAVLLPGACYLLSETNRPPIEAFRRRRSARSSGVCFAGVTRVAACTPRPPGEPAPTAAGERADLADRDLERLAELLCRGSFNPPHRRIRHGTAS